MYDREFKIEAVKMVLLSRMIIQKLNLAYITILLMF